MAYSFHSTPSWWDREFDAAGNPIREDVRASARASWQEVCDIVRKLLGDLEDAPQILERSIERVSKYLNDRKITPHDPKGLLILNVHRSTLRLAKRRRRLKFVGGTSELSQRLGTPDWTDAVERRMFLQELVVYLSPQAEGLLRFRMEGLEWEEIAEMLNRSASSIRRRFWRDVRRAHLELLSRPRRER